MMTTIRLSMVATLAPLWVAAHASAAGPGVAPADDTPWIHVRVQEGGDDAGTVNVNLPLSLVRVAIAVAPKAARSKAEVHLDEHGLSVPELRQLWEAIKTAGEAQFVAVEKEGQTVHIGRQGDHVVIDVERSPDSQPVTPDLAGELEHERVHVEVPIAVVDALLAGEEKELNLEAAVDRLAEERGEIVRVDDGETRVRIWIDEGW